MQMYASLEKEFDDLKSVMGGTTIVPSTTAEDSTDASAIEEATVVPVIPTPVSSTTSSLPTASGT